MKESEEDAVLVALLDKRIYVLLEQQLITNAYRAIRCVCVGLLSCLLSAAAISRGPLPVTISQAEPSQLLGDITDPEHRPNDPRAARRSSTT